MNWIRNPSRRSGSTRNFQTARPEVFKKETLPPFAWLVSVARQGNLDAQVTAAWMLSEGIGIKRNRRRGAMMFKEAAQLGNATAEYNFGILLFWGGVGARRNRAAGLELLRRAERHGSVHAMFLLGQFAYQGKFQPEDYHQAVGYFRRAALRGHIVAARYLAEAYDFGDSRGEGRNPRRAVFWYKRAAEAGDLDAMQNLGICYERGQGVRRNHQTALLWLRRAAVRGSEPAAEQLARVREQHRASQGKSRPPLTEHRARGTGRKHRKFRKPAAKASQAQG
jgi:TPR repeat protein